MKKLLLFILLCSIVEIHAQEVVSKTHIIYERKDQVVLNDGKQYQIVLNQPFYEVSDNTIAPYKESNGHVLRLNRILRLKDKDGVYIELIEWVKEEHIKLYLLRDVGKEQ